ncbi:hypothetical protein ISS30_01305 [bacterium]|nr:hypothetical protein [bacterium]
MNASLYSSYGSKEKETKILKELCSLSWLKDYVARPDYDNFHADLHDGAIILKDGTIVLVEIQHRKSESYGYCLDVISKIHDENLRDKKISPVNALDELKSISTSVRKWGKFLDKEFDADIIAYKDLVADELALFSTKKIAKKISFFLSKYSFKFNSKNWRTGASRDSHESAFIPIPVKDIAINNCRISSYEELILDLNLQLPKYADLGFY